MEVKNSFPIDSRNKVTRVPERGIYDRESIYEILDQSQLAHVSFVEGDQPTSIPMLFARIDNQLIFHGATSSRLMKAIVSGQKLCVSATLVDGLVLARSLFHHSMNYRSVVVFGRGSEVASDEKRMRALQAISDKVMPGRWLDARSPSPQELKATLIAAVEMETGSAKVRTGEPKDDPNDMDLPVWAGQISFQTRATFITDSHSVVSEPPNYVNQYVERFNSKQK